MRCPIIVDQQPHPTWTGGGDCGRAEVLDALGERAPREGGEDDGHDAVEAPVETRRVGHAKDDNGLHDPAEEEDGEANVHCNLRAWEGKVRRVNTDPLRHASINP